jgi:hypothetical protein
MTRAAAMANLALLVDGFCFMLSIVEVIRSGNNEITCLSAMIVLPH